MLEFLYHNNASHIIEDEDRIYPLFPRANPAFSIYLDQEYSDSEIRVEELESKFQEFQEYIKKEDNRKQMKPLIEEHLAFTYPITETIRPFTKWDYQKEHYRGILKVMELLNQAEIKYRAYRAAIREILFI